MKTFSRENRDFLYILLLSLLMFILSIVAIVTYSRIFSTITLARIDLALWFLTALIAYVVFWRGLLRNVMDKSITSVYLLFVVGLLETFLGRIGLTVNTLIAYGGRVILIGSSVWVNMPIYITLLITGSLLMFLSSVIKLLGLKDVYAEYYTFRQVTYSLKESTIKFLCKYRYFVVFLFSFTLRFIPELVVWPWLIGYDTPEYVATLKDYLVKPTFFTYTKWYGSYTILPPLLYLILYPIAHVIDPWYIFKVVPSIIFGLESVALMYFLDKGLKWNYYKCYIATILYSAYPISLRFSWDLHRNSLGNIFLFLAMGRLESKNNWRDPVLIAFTILGALSHQTTATLLAIIFLTYAALKAKGFERIGYLVLASTCIVMDVVYVKFKIILPNPVLGFAPAGFGGSTRPFISEFLKVVPLVFLPYWPLMPLLFFGYYKNTSLNTLTITLLFFTLSPVVTPYLVTWMWFRSILLLVIPLSIHAASALSKINKGAMITILLVLVLLSLNYTTSIEDSVIPAIFPRLWLPKTMVSSGIPPNYQGDVLEAGKWLSQHSSLTVYLREPVYTFIHIERRFGENLVKISDTRDFIINLYRRGFKGKIYILEECIPSTVRVYVNIGNNTLVPVDVNIDVVVIKDFGAVKLYEVSI